MITLSSELQARMDSTNRRPMIDVLATGAVAAVPFQGKLLTTESINEISPSSINHSSGRMVLVYAFDHDTIQFVSSDIARSSFSTVSLLGNDYSSILSVDLCEMSNTNIGIIYIENNPNYHQYQLKSKIVSIDGTLISSATINSWSHDVFTSGPTVVYSEISGLYTVIYTKISGEIYYLYKRTSPDFVTWSAETAIATGLDSSWKLFDPSIRKVSTSSGNDLILTLAVVEKVGPSGEALSNIYFLSSSNGGLTFTSASKVTNYTQFGLVATHPTVTEKFANAAFFSYNEKQISLTMDHDAFGWPTTYTGGSDPSDMHFDATNRKLYLVNAYKGVGDKALQSVVKIDVDTWTIDNTWSTETTPALHSYWNSGVHLWWNKDQGAGKYVPLSAYDAYGANFIQLIDGEENTIKTYAFEDHAEYGIYANISGNPIDAEFGLSGVFNGDIYATYIDLVNNRLWILLIDSYVYHHRIKVGYISLTDVGPTYSFIEVIDETDCEESEIIGIGANDFQVYPEDNLIVIAFSHSGVDDWTRPILVYELDSGDRLKKYDFDDDAEVPRHGLNSVFYYNNKLYGGIHYYNLYGQENMRGLAEIDMETDVVTCYRPTFASVDDYGLGDMVKTAGDKLLIASTLYGIVSFDINSKMWDRYDNTTIPGITPNNSNRFNTIAYDSENELIFGGVGNEYNYTWAGWVCFSLAGEFNQAQYGLANKISSWGFGEAVPLVKEYVDYDATIVSEPSTYGITAFWVNKRENELSIKWDRDNGEFSLTDLLVRGEALTIKRSVDGSPNTLNLTLSHGHLFDPFNLASGYSNILDKGKLIKVRFGENIDGTPSWVDAGSFHITSKKLNYQRGEYPTISVEASDKRYIWKDMEVVATDYYDGQQPENVLRYILEEFTPLTYANGDFAFEAGDIQDAVPIDIQWTETTLDDILQQVLDRFNYYLKVTNDDKMNVGRIAVDNAVTHTYTDSNQIIFVSPEDSFSDFTNRVVVEGQERDYSDVLYDEELVATLNGTVGWWGFQKDFKIYYSKDKSKRVRNPRLKVVETTTSIGFKLAGNISEELIDEDADEHYCVVRVEAPSLIGYLLAFIALKQAAGHIGDEVDAFIVGWTVPVGTAITNIASIGIMLVLGAVGNFQYEVYGLPIGEEKRSIQSAVDDSSCNDVEMQEKIGYIVEKRIEEPFCYTVEECMQVARNEMAIIKAQRDRVAIEKITHLQDEEGDTIRFIHPFSGQAMDVFVTDLTRTYTIPEGGESNASCVDQIEGWVLNQ